MLGRLDISYCPWCGKNLSIENAYTYIVLRYIPDVVIGEFRNVGVAINSNTYTNMICETSEENLSRAFPKMSKEHIKSLIDTLLHIESEFDAAKGKNVFEIATKILPVDDSSLQWSQMGSGLTEDVEDRLQKLYSRYITL